LKVGSSLVAPDWERLQKIGCISLGDSAVIGAIGLPVSATKFAHYDCRGVSSDALIGAVNAIVSDALGADGSASLMSSGFWFLIDQQYDPTCSATTYRDGGFYNGSGAYVLDTIGTGCTRRTYLWIPRAPGNEGDPGTIPEGGGGGGGSGGGPPPPSPGPLPPELPPISEDLTDPEPDIAENSADTLPVCSLPQPHKGRAAWCGGHVPLPGVELDRIRAAIERIRAIGGECSTLAAALDSVLAGGRLKITSGSIGGWSPLYMGGNAPVVINQVYVNKYYDFGRRGIRDGVEQTLQFILAHEIDHALGEDHTDPPRNLLTRRALMCSDVPSQHPPQVPS
jgi:hypothetical protein